MVFTGLDSMWYVFDASVVSSCLCCGFVLLISMCGCKKPVGGKLVGTQENGEKREVPVIKTDSGTYYKPEGDGDEGSEHGNSALSQPSHLTDGITRVNMNYSDIERPGPQGSQAEASPQQPQAHNQPEANDHQPEPVVRTVLTAEANHL